MPINPDAAGSVGEPREFSWTSDDSLLYSLGVGAGVTDPTGFELNFTTENSNEIEIHSIKKAKKLILTEKKNGADLVKIQTYEPEDITFRNVKKYFKLKSGIWKKMDLWKLYKKVFICVDRHTEFHQYKGLLKKTSFFKIGSAMLIQMAKGQLFRNP